MWKVTEHNQRKFDSLFAMTLNFIACAWCFIVSIRIRDRGVTYDGISKTLSHDLDHHDRHGHRDRVLPLRAKIERVAGRQPPVERGRRSPNVCLGSSMGSGAKIRNLDSL